MGTVCSIKSALATKHTLWANPLIDRATSRTKLDLRRFRREPMSLYIAIVPNDLQGLDPLVRFLMELFLAANTKAGETPVDDPDLNVPVLLLRLDQIGGAPVARAHGEAGARALLRPRLGHPHRNGDPVRGPAPRGLRPRARRGLHRQPQGTSLLPAPGVHRRDLAEAISKIVGQKTVKQTSFSYTDNKRSRQVSKTAQAILDAG